MNLDLLTHYIPAFLSFAARHLGVGWKHEEHRTVGTVVFSVTHRSGYSLARFKRFSEAQRACVVDFLKLVARHPNDDNAADASKALERYWLTGEAENPLIALP